MTVVTMRRGGQAKAKHLHLTISCHPAVECAMHQQIQAGGSTPKVTVRIDAALKKKCPRTALGCVTATVEAGASAAGLLEELKKRDSEIQKLPFPRGVLESPPI